jgi:hypothetical protein
MREMGWLETEYFFCKKTRKYSVRHSLHKEITKENVRCNEQSVPAPEREVSGEVISYR